LDGALKPLAPILLHLLPLGMTMYFLASNLNLSPPSQAAVFSS
jgi:hypothetical protein